MKDDAVTGPLPEIACKRRHSSLRTIRMTRSRSRQYCFHSTARADSNGERGRLPPPRAPVRTGRDRCHPT